MRLMSLKLSCKKKNFASLMTSRTTGCTHTTGCKALKHCAKRRADMKTVNLPCEDDVIVCCLYKYEYESEGAGLGQLLGGGGGY